MRCQLHIPSQPEQKQSVAAFNQEKALVGAFSVITNLRMELFEPVVGAAADADGERADAEVAAHLEHHARAVVEVGERHHRCGENYTCNNVMMTERQYVTLVKAKKGD